MARKRTARMLTIEKIINSASKSGNMNTAIRKFGVGISIADANILNKLTGTDLKAIARLRKKIGPLGSAAMDNNGGIF